MWYLDLFAGKNDYAAADKGGTGGHKEINRTALTRRDVEEGLEKAVVLDQLELMRLRNTSPAFDGKLEVENSDENVLCLTWRNGSTSASLKADLRDYGFSVVHSSGSGETSVLSYPKEDADCLDRPS